MLEERKDWLFFSTSCSYALGAPYEAAADRINDGVFALLDAIIFTGIVICFLRLRFLVVVIFFGQYV
jgi:hypothetical protein